MSKIRPADLNKQLYKEPTVRTFTQMAQCWLGKECGRSEQITAANNIIGCNLAVICSPKPDLFDLEECVNAIKNYFEITASKESRPTVSGICLSLGLSRQEFLAACDTGMIKDRKVGNMVAIPSEVHSLLLQVRDGYISMIEGFMETGLIHPASGIFLLKNNADYKDVVEKHYTVTQTTVDFSAMAEKYKLESGE